jgi:hypothetical protein
MLGVYEGAPPAIQNRLLQFVDEQEDIEYFET